MNFKLVISTIFAVASLLWVGRDSSVVAMYICISMMYLAMGLEDQGNAGR